MTTFSALSSANEISLPISGRASSVDSQSEFPTLNCGIEKPPSIGAASGRGPVTVASTTLGANRWLMFCGQLFEKIIVIPRVKPVGFVLSSYIFNVEVWNTHQAQNNPLTAISITGNGGLLISGGKGVSAIFGPSESSIYTATLGTDGDATIANVANFVFTGEAGTEMTVTGTRLTVFSPEIDWSEGFEETLSYMTNIIVAYSTLEQRIQLRTIPRYGASYRVVTLNARDTGSLDAMVAGWQSRVYGVPWWMDASPLTAGVTAGATTISVDTTLRPGFYAGGIVLIWRDQHTWEALSIQTLSSSSITLASQAAKSWNAGDLVIPVKRGRLADRVDVSHETSSIATFSASFDCEVV